MPENGVPEKVQFSGTPYSGILPHKLTKLLQSEPNILRYMRSRIVKIVHNIHVEISQTKFKSDHNMFQNDGQYPHLNILHTSSGFDVVIIF